MERMKKENKIHLEGAKVYGPQDYEVVDELKKLKEENKKLKEENEKLEEDNINLISFNEHYSPDVIVKYEDMYETAYNEECIENAKLCDKMRRLEEENKKLKSDLAYERTMLDNVRAEYKSLQNVIKKMEGENETLREELFSRIRQPQNTPYGKGVAELMEEDALQELKDIGEI